MDKKPTSFELAASKTLRRIRRDLESAPPRLKPILAYVESHLYDAGLDFQQLRIACKIRDNTVPIEFHSVIGMPPYTYIKHCRLETASRLLRDTDLKVWQICMLVGYSGIQVFSRAFLEWSGMRPTAYRKNQQCEAAASQNGQTAALPVNSTPPTSALLRRAVQGKLELEEANRLIGQLQRLYPQPSSGPRPATSRHRTTATTNLANGPLPSISDDLLLAASTIEQIRATEIWRALEQVPPSDWRQYLRSNVRMKSSALFDLLRQKSLEQGRLDRQQGLALAHLALESLELVDLDPSDCDRHALEIQAWSTIGNAHRLALDFLSAEKAFLQAERRLPEIERRNQSVASELRARKAALRWYQGHSDDALHLIDEALAFDWQLQNRNELVRALVLKSTIELHVSKVEEGLGSLREANRLVQEVNSPELKLSVGHNLAFLLTVQGEFQRASTVLSSIRSLSQALDIRSVSLKQTWIEGLVAQGLGQQLEAERFFREARDGFVSLDQTEMTAAVSLDLALLCARQGRSNEVLWLVSEVVPIFDALQHLESALVALKLLQGALENRKVTLSTLEKSRESALRLHRGPSLGS